MQFRLFTIPVSDNGVALEEMNKFLRGHKTIAVDKQLINSENSASWCFCINYIESSPTGIDNSRKDYKNSLSAEVFDVFSKLRKIRKEMADNDGVPAYAIFTDEELVGISGLGEFNVSNLQKIKGIGTKKVEKYGELLISSLLKIQQYETSR